MKLGKLVHPGFFCSINALNAKQLPLPVAYKIGKIAAKAAEEQATYFKLRAEAIDRLAVKDEEGKQKTFKGEDGQNYIDFGDNKAELDKQLAELADTEVEVPKIALSVLLKSNVEMNGAQLNDLMPIIDEDVEQ